MQPVERKIGEPDQLLGVVFSLEEVRELREEVLAAGGSHLTEVSLSNSDLDPAPTADSPCFAIQSSALWKAWRDFEMDLLKVSGRIIWFA